MNGNVDATGYVKSGDTADVVSGQDIWAKRYIYESGLRVYSPNNKPTAGDVGAYPKSGGTVNGSVVADRVSARDGNEIHMLGMRQGKAWLDYWDGNRWAGEIYHPKKSGILATLDDIDAASNIPVGAPIPWPQPNPPSGYLICNGQAFNKSTYPQLAAAYPSGRLPDLRGEFIRGWDDGRGVDSGRGILSLQNQQVQFHSHLAGHGGRGQGSFGITKAWAYPGSYHDDSKQALPFTNNGSDFDGFTNNGAVGAETRPRNIAFNYIVRAA
ncbi:tail fiber protein [Photorhabdus stackebrandtii]